MIVIGVDEAGRGSLVGELIVAAVAVPIDLLEDLKEIGVKDSKLLSPDQREELYRTISRRLVFSVSSIKPREIDHENINVLTSNALYMNLSRIFKRVDPESVERIVIDKFGSVPKIKVAVRKTGYRGKIIVEEKADFKYPEVAAASIIAKYVRDSRIKVLSSLYGVRGSGYPSDPRTVEWLQEVLARGNPPPIIRFSWGTLKGTGYYVKKKKSASNVTLEDFL